MVYFAKNLKFLRKNAGEEQRDLALFLGVSKPTVSKYENAITEPDLEKIVLISERYKVTLDELILTEIKPPQPVYVLNIKYLREKHKKTQIELSKFLGFKNKSSYCLIESGNSGISIENLSKLADYFGVTLDQLVKQDLRGGIAWEH